MREYHAKKNPHNPTNRSLWNSGVGGYIISPKISGLKRSIL